MSINRFDIVVSNCLFLAISAPPSTTLGLVANVVNAFAIIYNSNHWTVRTGTCYRVRFHFIPSSGSFLGIFEGSRCSHQAVPGSIIICSLCLGPIGDFCIGDGEMYSYTRDASRCLAILSINTSRLFTEGSVIPPEHRLMLVNFHRECIGDAKKSPVGPRHSNGTTEMRTHDHRTLGYTNETRQCIANCAIFKVTKCNLTDNNTNMNLKCAMLESNVQYQKNTQQQKKN